MYTKNIPIQAKMHLWTLGVLVLLENVPSSKHTLFD